MNRLHERIDATLDELRAAGTYKELGHLTAPMGPTTTIEAAAESLREVA